MNCISSKGLTKNKTSEFQLKLLSSCDDSSSNRREAKNCGGVAGPQEGQRGTFSVWGPRGLSMLFGGSSDCGEPVRKQRALRMLSFAKARFSLAGHKWWTGAGELVVDTKSKTAMQKPM